MWCKSRLNTLWKTLQQCSTTYQSLERLNDEITAHFEQMIKVLIAQEHKVKTPINVQMELVKSTINNIINEIKDINSIINLTHPVDHNNNNNNNNNDSDGLDVYQKIINTITSCTSIEQFINIYTPTIVDDDGSRVDDDQLLTMIKNHVEHISMLPYDDDSTAKLQACQVRIDTNKLNDVKKQIESCFTLIDPTKVNKPKEFDRHVFTFNKDDCSLFSLDTFTWKSTNRVHNRSSSPIFTSTVYARGSVYIFGGGDSPATYTRYSLIEKQAYSHEMVGITGGRLLSAVYDGDNHIYLVGGLHDFNFLDIVQCFNIDTQQISLIGHIPYGLSNPFIHFHNDIIYIVGGNRSVAHRDFISFNVKTLTSEVLLRDISTNQKTSCFDGKDNIYIITSQAFIRYTLSNKQSTKLSMPPRVDNYLTILYDEQIGILYIGGKGKNYRYTVQNNQWLIINDNDYISDRTTSAVCLIRN
ncbi:hypothetical protein SAMD00019534_054740 [Acytostelium subglobosum LB1]|uniref:hypothetical protein n=1 Tax=Acytostelium subglobosum LB1 TaxID=1410327 RepID=UPI00064481E0|nr:hypothetical protein SAMD00019534_054740 [Acytostelium subglobosum LB1]GAM22299.1 hypothetical protein SAMD00019534_054740 [Acytostelium subglobosum LB1]|eukprot:XP_012754419.1 hypothetical protein SAMD00019534_054740 [Acytostelium subglobosum LB1]